MTETSAEFRTPDVDPAFANRTTVPGASFDFTVRDLSLACLLYTSDAADE